MVGLCPDPRIWVFCRGRSELLYAMWLMKEDDVQVKLTIAPGNAYA